jgi:beta-lactamase regulating signal transducer with metallopeptidase domain
MALDLHGELHDDPPGDLLSGLRQDSRLVAIICTIVIHLVLLTVLVNYREQVRVAVEDVVSRGSAHARHISTPPATFSLVLVEWTDEIEALPMRFSLENWLDHLWQSTLIATVLGLLTLAFRRNRARVRYGLWFAASLKFLVPFTLLIALFRRLVWSWPWPSVMYDLARSPLVDPILSPAMSATVWPAAAIHSEAALHPWRGIVFAMVLGGWACGFLAIIWTRLRAWRRLRDTVDSSRPVRLELDGIAIPASVRVRAADGLLEPGVVGWIQPVLLMPADIEQHLTRPEIVAIVAHELCHVRRYDNFTAAIHMVAEAIFWFHPLVWWIGARLLDERERACDEHVLRTGSEPGCYAQGILNVCKRYVESPLASVSGVGSADVPKRIEAILTNQVGEAVAPWKTIVVSTTIVLLTVVSIGVGAVSAPQPGKRSVFVRAADLQRVPYTLVRAYANGQLGPNLTPSFRPDPGCDPCVVKVGPGLLEANDVTMPFVAKLLSAEVHSRVEDHTGLTGRYNLRLTWSANGDTVDPSLFGAVQEQLGLTLKPR